MRELVIPVPAERDDGIEMARIWITSKQGKSFVSLHHGMFEEKELEIWGSLAADFVAHVVRAHLQNGNDLTGDEAFAALEKGFRQRLADNPILEGVFTNRALS